MKNKRMRNLIIIFVFVLIAYYLVPLFMQWTTGVEKTTETLSKTKLPWQFLTGSDDDSDEAKSLRLWTGKQLKLGLDLQGGMQLDMQVEYQNLPEKERDDAVEAAVEIIRNRIDQFGVAEPSIQRHGDDRIIVQLPGLQDKSRAKNLIGKTALLEFKLVAKPEDLKTAADRIDKYLEQNIKTEEYKYLEDFYSETSDEEIAEDILGDMEETAVDDTTSKEDVAAKADSIDAVNNGKIFTRLISNRGYGSLIANKNVDKFERLLADPKIQSRIPSGLQFLLGKVDKKDPLADRVVYLVYKNAEVSGSDLADARVNIGQGNNPQTAGKAYVTLEFNKEGSKKFATVTGQNIQERLAICLDDVVYIAPTIQNKIRGEASITGLSDLEEAQDIVIVLKAGNLPAPVKVIQERSVGATLGQDSIKAGFMAALIGLAIVIIFMIIYYGMSGFFANLAVAINVGFILAALTMLEAALTMPGIAGIILTIGMAVDANVLIFERIREELKSGKTVRSSVDSGFSRAMITILDANITTLITAIVLYQFGTGPIKGFAVTLSIGIIGSMFCSIILVKAMFDWFVTNKNRKTLSIGKLRFFESSKFDCVGSRKVTYIISAVVILAGLVSLAVHKGPNYSIDFTGGTSMELDLSSDSGEKVTLEELRSALEKEGFDELEIMPYKGTDIFVVKSKKNIAVESENSKKIDVSAIKGDKILAAIEKHFPQFQGKTNELIRSKDEVGPRIGNELKGKAIWAIFYALLGIILYIWWRFELTFGWAAVLALVHDVLITVGIFSIFGKEISLSIVAALLTIVGYSLNDTIVVFDRIREDLKIYRRESYQSVINHSINETLSRTIITSLTTLIVVLALYFLGGSVIHDFAFALMVGVIVGTYSSIFIASPVLVDYFLRREKKKGVKRGK